MTKHMKVNIVSIIIVISIISIVIVCMRNKQIQVNEPEFVFSYAENQAEGYPTTLGGYKFAELVEERTNGRIKIIVQAEGILGNETEVIEQLQFGGVDFARISLTQLAIFIPEFNILQMPYLYKDAKHMWKVLESEIGDYFLKRTEAFDTVGLSWYDAGARNFYNTVRPINTLEDIKGLNIRVQESELMKDVVEALGAVATPLAYDQVYSGLERGIIDGAENNWPSYESTDHFEVAKYYTIDEHARVPEMQLCAQATWDKLSLEDQEVIRLCAQESALYERELWIEREKKSREIAEKKGVQVTELSPKEKERFKEAVEKVYEKYLGKDKEVIKAIVDMGK